MSILVVDASALLAIILAEPEVPKISAIMDNGGFQDLVAPTIAPIEIANAIYKVYLTRRIGADHLQALSAMAAGLDIRLVAQKWQDAKASADFDVKNSIAAYDSCYLLLAQQLGAPILTTDKGMRRVATSLAIQSLP